MSGARSKLLLIDDIDDLRQGDVRGRESDDAQDDELDGVVNHDWLLDEVENEIRSYLASYKKFFDDLDAERRVAGLHDESIIQSTRESFMQRLDGILTKVCNEDYKYIDDLVREWDEIKLALAQEFDDLPNQIQLCEEQRLKKAELEEIQAQEQAEREYEEQEGQAEIKEELELMELAELKQAVTFQPDEGALAHALDASNKSKAASKHHRLEKKETIDAYCEKYPEEKVPMYPKYTGQSMFAPKQASRNNAKLALMRDHLDATLDSGVEYDSESESCSM